MLTVFLLTNQLLSYRKQGETGGSKDRLKTRPCSRTQQPEQSVVTVADGSKVQDERCQSAPILWMRSGLRGFRSNNGNVGVTRLAEPSHKNRRPGQATESRQRTKNGLDDVRGEVRGSIEGKDDLEDVRGVV